MKRSSMLLIAALGVAMLAVASYWLRDEDSTTASNAVARDPSEIVATRQDLRSYVSLSGVLHHRVVHYIHARIDGTVRALRAKVGDEVSKGAILLEFDPAPMHREEEQIGIQEDAVRMESELLARERDLQKQRADREAAELGEALRMAAEDVEQARQAFERGMISDAERRKARMKVDELDRQRELAQAVAAQAEQRFEIEAHKLDRQRRALRVKREELALQRKNMSVLSPANGRIISITERLATGHDATGMLALRAGEPIGAVAEQGRYAITVTLSEREVLKIRAGSFVRFVQKSGGAEGSGVVRAVRTPAEGSPAAAGAFSAEIEVETVRGEVVVGGRVECRILTAERIAVIAIPIDAVWVDRGHPYVRVFERDQIVHRQLRLGVDDGTMVEVLHGIADGERVARAPVARKDGEGRR